MRKFMRYPVSVPIELLIERSSAAQKDAHITSISLGGLAFRVSEAVEVGAEMVFSVPQLWPGYSFSGAVKWCHVVDGGFAAGVHFSEMKPGFKARMVAQLCQIEHYRAEVADIEGRVLSQEDAAQEWVSRHAEEFAKTIGWN